MEGSLAPGSVQTDASSDLRLGPGNMQGSSSSAILSVKRLKPFFDSIGAETGYAVCISLNNVENDCLSAKLGDVSGFSTIAM